MQKTYETLHELSKLHSGNTSLESLSLDYQSSRNPEIISYVFCKLFNLSVSNTNRYFTLTDADKASFCLEELDKAMLAFDATKGTKFSTLYVTYLLNRLRVEAYSLTHQLRKGNYDTESLDIEQNDDNFSIIQGMDEKEYDVIDLHETLESFNLTPNELSYCKIATKYTSLKDTDIATMLGISSAAITYLRRSLSKKLSPSICF